MGKIEKELLTLLDTVESVGSFACSGVKKFTHPALEVLKVDTLSFPLNNLQLKALIRTARKAPFGKGSKTITDTTVRSAWEIDASQIVFHDDNWDNLLKKILKNVKKGLGLGRAKVTASLYKLLIYEKGDFFLPHKDSEKEKGMFGTLVVGLPTKHSGGELVVRHKDEEETFDFSLAASDFKIPFAAFYADCDHELKPVTSGHRVVLVYNLIQTAGKKIISADNLGQKSAQLASIMQHWPQKITWHEPKVVLLGHQYTPSNFSMANLKSHDRPRAEILLDAADKAGYFAALALATCYQMGDLEGDYDYHYGYRGRGRDPKPGTMGDEIFEEYTELNHWGEEGIPGLGTLMIDEEELIRDIEIKEGDPTEQEEEGYTGNAGMTMEYWYHYGAVVLWPKKLHLDFLQNASTEVMLDWLNYYVDNWDDPVLQSPQQADELLSLLTNFDKNEYRYQRIPNFTPLVRVLAKMEDESVVTKHASTLIDVFPHILIRQWADLINQFPPDLFSPIIQQVGNTSDPLVINHLFGLLKWLLENGPEPSRIFAIEHISQAPTYLTKIKLHLLKENSYYPDQVSDQQKAITGIVEKLLYFSQHMEDTIWTDKTITALTRKMPRNYVNKVLCKVLLEQKTNKTTLTNTLLETCIADLEARTEKEPSPPPNWKRSVPKTKSNQKIWEMLTPFLRSPTLRTFDYTANQSLRKEMQNAINRVTIDLKTETIEKGRPYTLRLIKTHSAFERSHTQWKEDRAILKKMRKL